MSTLVVLSLILFPRFVEHCFVCFSLQLFISTYALLLQWHNTCCALNVRSLQRTPWCWLWLCSDEIIVVVDDTITIDRVFFVVVKNDILIQMFF